MSKSGRRKDRGLGLEFKGQYFILCWEQNAVSIYDMPANFKYLSWWSGDDNFYKDLTKYLRGKSGH